MTRLKVNPTRMVMNELQAKLDVAKQGHRLLKEKQDSMIRQFMSLYDKATVMRRQVEDDFSHIYRYYGIASVEEDELVLKNAMIKDQSEMHVMKKPVSVMGIHTYTYVLDNQESLIPNTEIIGNHYVLDVIRTYHDSVRTHIVELASLEESCERMADEIRQTRRRVNALEHKTIPNIEETIKYIRQRIDDQVRSQQARIMKVTR